MKKKNNKYYITKKYYKKYTKKNKNLYNKKNKYKKSKKIYGGDIINRLFCKNGTLVNPRPALHPEEYTDENHSVALEYFYSINNPFEVCRENLNQLLFFKMNNFKWFKFLIFIINRNTYIYAIDGFPKVNKHPLCYLFGILEKTEPDEYLELKKIFNVVKLMKDSNTPNVNENTPEIIELNSQIFANLGCMRVKSGGSGTLINDDTICINNKSGHFKASFDDIEPYAKNIFIEKTGLNVFTTIAPNKEKILQFLDSKQLDRKLVNRFSGLCI